MVNGNKINILHLVLSLETGGLERIVAESALAIDKDIFNVEVCCIDRLGEFTDLLSRSAINVSLLEKNQAHYDYFYPFRLRKFLLEKNIQVLHLHSGTFFLGTQAGILARTPVIVYTDHGRHLFETKMQLFTDRFSGYFVDRIVAVSNELEYYLINNIKLPKNKITSIINGINIDEYFYREKPLSLLREFCIEQKDKVIGTVGRLAEVKDQITLLEAFSVVHQRIPNTVLLLVGNGPMKNELINKIIELNLNDCVEITGNRNDVSALLNIFDIFVLSSLSEGTSVALLEAMSSGIAPIVTNVGGNPSIVENNINGVLINPKNVDELAENLISLLQNDERRLTYGRNASQKVREKFSIANMVKIYENMYLSLLKEKKGDS